MIRCGVIGQRQPRSHPVVVVAREGRMRSCSCQRSPESSIASCRNGGRVFLPGSIRLSRNSYTSFCMVSPRSRRNSSMSPVCRFSSEDLSIKWLARIALLWTLVMDSESTGQKPRADALVRAWGTKDVTAFVPYNSNCRARSTSTPSAVKGLRDANAKSTKREFAFRVLNFSFERFDGTGRSGGYLEVIELPRYPEGHSPARQNRG